MFCIVEYYMFLAVFKSACHQFLTLITQRRSCSKTEHLLGDFSFGITCAEFILLAY